MEKKNKLFLFFVFAKIFVFSQIGPNNPATAANDAATGTSLWLNPNNCFTSNNARATQSVQGLSQYLKATNFGFAIGAANNIDGIRVEIERSTIGSSDVAILSGWQTGLVRSAAIPAGRNRLLIFSSGFENGAGVTKSLTAVSYGGQSMTRAILSATGTAGGFSGSVELWYLLEAGIAAATSTSFVVTESVGTELEIVRHRGHVVFQHVDQFTSIFSSGSSSFNGSANPLALPAMAVLKGSMAVTMIMCGSVPNSNPACGTSNASFIPQTPGYTEGYDTYTCNASCCSTSGANFETATAPFTATGTTAPSFSYQGTPNRLAAAGIILQRAQELDVNVRIVKAGVVQTTNLASTLTAWPEVDAYQAYGGPTNLWGTTWTPADINNAGFGAAISGRVQNGTAAVDHIRITVFLTSTLPIELLGFDAAPQNQNVICNWSTATEIRSSHFEIERSRDGVKFEYLGRVQAAGESYSFKHYEFLDTEPLDGISYYRLKKIDLDRSFDYTQLKAVNFSRLSDLLIYPNPSPNLFTIEEKDFKQGSLSLFNEDGKLLKVFEHPKHDKFSISLGDLADGTYLIVLEENGIKKVKKIIKQTRQQ